MATDWADFIEVYNHELRLLGVGLRVRVAGNPWQTGDLIVVDAHGRILGPMPASIEPVECAAIEGLTKAAYTWGATDAREGSRTSILASDEDSPS